jgi:DNA-binding NtrC family response regulator
MPDDATVTVVQPSARADALGVRVVTGAEAGQVQPLREDRPLTIGSSPDNALRLADPTVSRYHLEVRVAPGGAHVHDLGSLNGSWLGEARIEAAVLPVGAELRVGQTLLCVETAAAARPGRDDPQPVALPGLVAVSPPMRRVAETVTKLAPAMVSVLIEGETGTGKEVVAAAMHALGSRAAGPFVVVDCGALPSTLIASELFGHERGAFTGASRRHVGAFERARGGTLFLDEIGELPLDLQPALLGVLERRRFRRLGGEQDIPTDVRVLSATHRDLRAAANHGRFRSDLYFRLAVSRVLLPPLRDRPEDIPALVSHFVEVLTGSATTPGLDAAAVADLANHAWRGNVRELKNFVENAVALGSLGADIEAPADGASEATFADAPAPATTLSYRAARAQALTAFERGYVAGLIGQSGGNASEAARRAQMDRAYLLTLLKRHGLR